MKHTSSSSTPFYIKGSLFCAHSELGALKMCFTTRNILKNNLKGELGRMGQARAQVRTEGHTK